MDMNNKATTKKRLPKISEQYADFPSTIHMHAVGDDYRIFSTVLGIGINGKVLKCQHRQSERNCALKIVIDSDIARREVILHKKACKECSYIVQVLDVYQNMYQKKQCLLIIMECMDGGELFNRIQQRQANPYTERDAANLIRMMVQAVAHLHTMDMAHRDLKPENFLLTSKDKDAILKLSDFGFAKEGNNESKPLHTPCYTAYYASPEVLSNTAYDKACDIWSMGVIIYILLSGRPPFYSADGSNMSDGMRGRIKAGEYQFDLPEWSMVSEEAKSMIARMLIVNPAERITITEILDCSWLVGFSSESPIHTGSAENSQSWEQIRTEFASAIDDQRRPDEDSPVEIFGPEASSTAKKRAAKKRSGPTTP